MTVRTILAVTVQKKWSIHQLDVNNAFLRDLNEEVYMKVSKGFVKTGDTRVCKLRKSLYGLHQASRNWCRKFTEALLEIGFRHSKADHLLFVFKANNNYVAALIYVDDVILLGNNDEHIDKVKTFLHKKFNIKDLGPLKYFLGIEAIRTEDGMVLSQRKYTLDILSDSGLQGSRPSSIPMETNVKLDHAIDAPLVDA